MFEAVSSASCAFVENNADEDRSTKEQWLFTIDGGGNNVPRGEIPPLAIDAVGLQPQTFEEEEANKRTMTAVTVGRITALVTLQPLPPRALGPNFRAL